MAIKYNAGDIREIVGRNSIGDIRLEVKSGESGKINFGGFRADDDSGVTGGGSLIRKAVRKPWSLEVSVMVDLGMSGVTLEDLAISEDETTWVITLVDGSVYTGNGIPVGDLDYDTAEAQAELKIVGSDYLRKLG